MCLLSGAIIKSHKSLFLSFLWLSSKLFARLFFYSVSNGTFGSFVPQSSAVLTALNKLIREISTPVVCWDNNSLPWSVMIWNTSAYRAFHTSHATAVNRIDCVHSALKYWKVYRNEQTAAHSVSAWSLCENVPLYPKSISENFNCMSILI